MWHEHDLGEYATVGLFWEPFEIAAAPWNYISRAEDKLSRFNDSVDWSLLSPPADDDEADPENGDEDYGEDNESSTSPALE